MPARENRCHCGVLRSESAAAHGESDSASSGSLGRAVLVVGLLAAGGFGFYAAQQRERRLQEQAAPGRVLVRRLRGKSRFPHKL